MRKSARDSVVVRAGRMYQKIPPGILRMFDIPFNIMMNESGSPFMIFLLAPPRSGSTLTYQILTSGIQSFYLSNIWNLFYATPLMGGWLNKRLESKKQVSFSSDKGFVPGIMGQAEGLAFWKYWMGQGLDFRPDLLNMKKLSKLKFIMSKVQGLYDKKRPFISAYLGHVFSVDSLRQAFDNILFIHLKRDLISNAKSIYTIRTKDPAAWFSVRPEGCRDDSVPLIQQICKQIYFTHKHIIEQSGADTFSINYNEICEGPQNFLYGFRDFCERSGFEVQLVPENIPNSFVPSVSDKDDCLTADIVECFDKLEDVYKMGIFKLKGYDV